MTAVPRRQKKKGKSECKLRIEESFAAQTFSYKQFGKSVIRKSIKVETTRRINCCGESAEISIVAKHPWQTAAKIAH